jgi:hypothetical protein
MTALIVVERQNASLVLAATWIRSVTELLRKARKAAVPILFSFSVLCPTARCHAVAGGIH